MAIKLILRNAIYPLLIVALLGCAGIQPHGVWDGKTHVVYHLSELGKVNFVLNNISNHVKGAGGAEHVDIVLVVHGPALRAFEKEGLSKRVAAGVTRLRDFDTHLVACGNTLRMQSLTVPDLVDGFQVAEEGGVTRIAALQSAGYLYLRP
ncbi:MAG: hypothetical protein C0618_10835 [Desulfuromonas sp.]|nr:MAG: hypothetical protein C0618_10835 [Desulfuromonas sp.]